MGKAKVRKQRHPQAGPANARLVQLEAALASDRGPIVFSVAINRLTGQWDVAATSDLTTRDLRLLIAVLGETRDQAQRALALAEQPAPPAPPSPQQEQPVPAAGQAPGGLG